MCNLQNYVEYGLIHLADEAVGRVDKSDDISQKLMQL